MGWAVPSCVSRLISIVRLNLVLIYDISPEFRGGVQFCIKTAIRHRVTQLRTDGVHCQESTSTGPVNLKVVPNGSSLGRSPWTKEYAPPFPTPTIGMD